MNELNTAQVKDSLQIRLMENIHILLWLVKDLCWSMEWKWGGVGMVVPTVSMALYITWKSRKVISEFIHSIAVCCWICANSIWMIGEFTNHEWRHYAAVLFAVGLVIILCYYLFYYRKDRQMAKQVLAAVNDSPTSNQQ